ncbi:hypothetical protein KIW84_033647 [Lathyrus oleraceus]|uniref:DEAD/DEAH-box helicase domain-containing protein n=1 Tax=Pisum sativum TaxID=3888 RepID=A0A9D4Y1W5_PEA|nr:hypothetical protein KIW84_033647 [Pisum sativum]
MEEAEKTWSKLLQFESNPPSQAFVYKMEVYSKVGVPMKSLEVFREMRLKLGKTSVPAYNKIIEILCKAQESEFAESIMIEFVNSGLKPHTPSYVYLLNMYFNLESYDKLEEAFSQCLEKCHPNSSIYSIYLDSLVKVGKLDKAEDIFCQMFRDASIGANARSSALRHVEDEADYMALKKVELEEVMDNQEFTLEAWHLKRQQMQPFLQFYHPLSCITTGAFCVPALEKIDQDNNVIQVVILVPTRELALQTSQVCKELAKHL